MKGCKVSPSLSLVFVAPWPLTYQRSWLLDIPRQVSCWEVFSWNFQLKVSLSGVHLMNYFSGAEYYLEGGLCLNRLM